MKNLKKITIKEDATIERALIAISKGEIKIVIVVDNKGKLIGTLTDGDIRRGFLKGLSISNSVNSLINRKPLIGKRDTNRKKLIDIAISKKIQQIPVVDDSGKVIEVILTDEISKKKDKSNKVLIMAGGRGLRLRPLTKNMPKPMLKVGNKPILQTIIEKFKDSGYVNFIICVNYKSQIIQNYFGNGNKFGVNIEYYKEKKRMGTAGSLGLIKKKLTDPFFVINGDILTNLDFEKLFDYHKANSATATMCIKEYNINLPYGEIKLNKKKIKSINEKPNYKFFVNSGIYIFDPKCTRLIPKKIYDMPQLFKKLIKKKFKVVSFPLGEYWLDIGRLADFKKANEEFKYNL